MIYDVIIVGSGISGLNTAHQLKKKSPKLKILMLEKESRIGGRIQSINLHQNMNYEAGAIRFYPQHKKLLKLLGEFKLTKKDFYKIPNDFPRKYAFTQKKYQKFTESELDLYQELLNPSNIEKIPTNQRLKVSLEEYATNVLGKAKLEYLKVINAFPHIFQTSMKYGLELLDRDFIKVKEFYILKTLTLTDFLYLMLEQLEQNNLDLHLSEEFISYTQKNSQILEIQSNLKKYETKNLVLALPTLALQKLKVLPTNLVKSTIPVPLCRMFAIYPANNYWYDDITATYSNENIQRIYLKGSRLIQIAYSSADQAKFWKDLSKNQMKLKKELQIELQRMFPKKTISNPEYLRTHYWDSGVHLWKKNKKGNEITETIIKPLKNKNLYICNEAYSKCQRWMEGAVEMSERVADLIIST